MLYTICIALILVASVLVILAVLVQNPKLSLIHISEPTRP